MDKCWPANAMLKPVDLCLLISTRDISQTHLNTIKITAHVNKTKHIILMLYLKPSGNEQGTFKKSFSVPWIDAHQ